MNKLIITLGNRDIQFDRNALTDEFQLEDTGPLKIIGNNLELEVRPINQTMLIPASSRHGGEYIESNYLLFRPILKYPLVQSLVDHIVNERISLIIWVVTDQLDMQHRKNDTLYYASILEKYFNESLPEPFRINYSTITVTDHPQDMDYQYRHIGDDLDELPGLDDGENYIVYLFAQGGIDQINYSLTLQLIQRYKERVIQLQKPEGAGLTMLRFPQLFLRDLNKQKIIKHLEDYDFGKAAELMLDNPKAKRLAEYCDLRLSLNHTRINQDDINNIYRFEWSVDLVVQQRAKAQDLVYAFMIDIHQKKYNDALTKLYTIFENGFKLWVDKHARIETSQYFQNDHHLPGHTNQRWIEFIENKFSKDLLKVLEDRKVSLNNPNAMCYYYICKYGLAGNLATEFPLRREDVDKMFRVLSDLRAFRNRINHNLGSVLWDDILRVLGKNKITYEQFKQLLNHLTETQADFGMYQTIRDELLMKYTDQHP